MRRGRGAQVDFDNALAIEGRYFTQLVVGPVAKNMMKAFFFDMQAIRAAAASEGRPKYVAKAVGILGAA